jgi:hypothetical protein
MFYNPKGLSTSRSAASCCGRAAQIVSTVLLYLGRDGTSEKPEDLAAAKGMMAIRPHIRHIDNERHLRPRQWGNLPGSGWQRRSPQPHAPGSGTATSSATTFRVEGAVMFIDDGHSADSLHQNAICSSILLRLSSPPGTKLCHAATSKRRHPIDPAIYNDRAIFFLARNKAATDRRSAAPQAYTHPTRMRARLKVGR